jgi:hypothetical protein
MSKCGPVNSQSCRSSSAVPIHIPLRVPTIRIVLMVTLSPDFTNLTTAGPCAAMPWSLP